MIAAGLAPDNCSVVRVMTPHPDTALPSTSILDALKKMHGNICKNMLENLFIMMINRWSLFEFASTGRRQEFSRFNRRSSTYLCYT